MYDAWMFIATSHDPLAAPKTISTAAVVTTFGATAASTNVTPVTSDATTTTGPLAQRCAARPTKGIATSAPRPTMSSVRPMVRGSASSRSRVAGRRAIHEEITQALSPKTRAVAYAARREPCGRAVPA